jgi:hypothetical protein
VFKVKSRVFDDKLRGWVLKITDVNGENRVVIANPLGYEAILRDKKTKTVNVLDFGVFPGECGDKNGVLTPFLEEMND